MPPEIRTEDPAPYGDTAPAPATCLWTWDDSDEYWITACGHGFTFIDDGPQENSFSFCPYCGRALQIATDEADEADNANANAN